MKVMSYISEEPTYMDNDQARGVAGRVVIGKNDGANHFCMRVFEVAPGGFTPKHAHDWEHEIFIHAGAGEVYGNGVWNAVRDGDIVFVPPSEEHQLRNTGETTFVFACLIPSGIPEL
jgi:quercetin dioxygenase-like cupin family protein